MPPGSRLAIEKPFGEDLHAAIALNSLLAELFPRADAVFRVDHALGMPAVEELVELDADAGSVEEVEILWEETLAFEGRAGFYDAAERVEGRPAEPHAPVAHQHHDRAVTNRLEALRAVR